MICRQCLRRASALPLSKPLKRNHASAASPGTIATASARPNGHPAATSTSAAQPFSNPLSPGPNPKSPGKDKRPAKPVEPTVESSCPAGTPLKGLNFFKGKDDPVALPEQDYPSWLWRCLDSNKDGEEFQVGDLFAKSKKQRRMAMKAQRDYEAKLLAEGNLEALAPKVPLQQQSIDLAWNADGNVRGALKAKRAREDVTDAMRKERRAKIKETNFLKGVR